MIVNSRQRRKIPRGTSLLEAVIAIGVIMVGVVGTLVLINSTIRLGRTNQDRIVAQDLAREGIELAYAQRNSGSLGKVLFPGDTWDKYFTAMVAKVDVAGFYGAGGLYETKYNIGDYDSVKKDCMVIDAACTDSSYPDWQYCTDEDDDNPNDDVNDEVELSCEVYALAAYLFGGYSKMPPRCTVGDTQALSFWNGSDVLHSSCHFSQDETDPTIDISDLSWMVYDLMMASYPLQTAFPTIHPLGTQATTAWRFYNPQDFDGTTGAFTMQTAWDYIPTSATEKRSRIFEYQGTYIQNVSVPGSTPSKYYRVVTFQPVCRGTNDPDDSGPLPSEEQENVIPQNIIFNCYSYLRTLPNTSGEGWNNAEARTAADVGVLVTSEVRWPTPSASATHVVYQEYLYDWLNI